MSWIYQSTLKQSFSLSGNGVHSGQSCYLRCYPAPVNFGIQFCIQKNQHHRTNRIQNTILSCPDSTRSNLILADLKFVFRDYLQLSLISRTHLYYVDTVEHLLAAMYALGLTNCLVELTNSEIPIFDGSASVFVDAILEADTIIQPARLPVYVVDSNIKQDSNNSQSSAELSPYDGFWIESKIFSPQKMSEHQSYSFKCPGTIDNHTMSDLFISVRHRFINHLAQARTFGFLSDWEKLKQQGFAHGSSTENTIVFDNRVIMNPPMRYPNECARHKIVDFLGALALLPFRVQAHFILNDSNHRLDIKLMHRLSSMISS